MRRLVLLALANLAGVAPLCAQALPSPSFNVIKSGDVGSTTLLGRTLVAHAAERLDVKDFGAVGDGVADDSAALAAAITAANARATTAQQVCLYLPGGRYRIAATALPTFLGNGCVEGDGTNQSYVVVDKAYAGDVFSWDEAWMAQSYFNLSGPFVALGQRAGPKVKGVTISGDLSALSVQNALMFYDRADLVDVSDVDVMGMHGRCFATGLTRTVTAAYMRESHFLNTRFWACGTATLPAVEIGSNGSATDDATNEIDWTGLSILDAAGKGLVIRNQGARALRDVRITGLRVEGPTGSASAGDLVTIGDQAYTGIVSNVTIEQLQTNGVPAGYSSLVTTAPSAASQPYGITVKGIIGNGAGKGLNVQAGRGMRFDLAGISTAGTQVTVGATPLVGSDILLNAWGQERYFSYSVDPSALPFFHTPGPFKVGDPSKPNAQALVAKVHDNSPSGGFPAGQGAVDLQVDNSGTDGARVAQGRDSVLVGGFDNRAGNDYSVQVGGQSNLDNAYFGVGVGGQGNNLSGYGDVIVGGTFNFLSGAYSGVLSGSYATDRGRIGWQGFAGGKIGNPGDAQTGVQLLRMSGTSAMRLTADGVPAGSVLGAGACPSIPDNAAYGLVVTLEAIDTVAPGTHYAARWTAAHELTRGTGAGSTLLDGTTVSVNPDSSRGSGSAIAFADTTNGCLAVNFTPPNGDTWHAVARVETVEVQ